MFSTRAAARFLLLRFGAQPRRRPRQAAPLLGDISRWRHLPVAATAHQDQPFAPFFCHGRSKHPQLCLIALLVIHDKNEARLFIDSSPR